MPRTPEVRPFYIRTRQGECFYVDTLGEALEEFLSEDGYRLSITAKDKKLVIRRTSEWVAGLTDGEKECTAALSNWDKGSIN